MSVTLEVDVQRASEQPGVPSSTQITAWVRAAWHGGDEATEVVVRICDEAESQRLNHDFRGMDKPTNVLSFAYEPHPGIAPYHLGDLVICAPVVAREAAEQCKRADAHWAHMVVHGMLHLQGHDHLDDAQAAAMETCETDILTALGFPAPYQTDGSDERRSNA